MVATDKRYFKLGLLGHPVSHSISPLLHGAALSYANLDGHYDLIDVEPKQLQERLPELVAAGYTGLNVTVPHKQAVLRLVDELTDEARKVQAVNTLLVTAGSGRLIGHNTDLGGFIKALGTLLPSNYMMQGRQAVILGAGGAARAGLWGLIDLGWQNICIVARDVSQAQVLASSAQHLHVSVTAPQDAHQLSPSLVVNCTPVGLRDAVIPDWVEKLLIESKAPPDGKRYFFDMVYSKGAVPTLVALARKHNWQTMDGLPMLVEQATLSFHFWTGVEVDAAMLLGLLVEGR